MPWVTFWMQACRPHRAAQLSILQVAKWVVRKSGTSSAGMTLLNLLPGAFAMVAAVYFCPGATGRCNKERCGGCWQSPTLSLSQFSQLFSSLASLTGSLPFRLRMVIGHTFYITGWSMGIPSKPWISHVAKWSSDMPHSASRITTQFCPSLWYGLGKM